MANNKNEHPGYAGTEPDAIDFKNPPKPIAAEDLVSDQRPHPAFAGEKIEAVDYKNLPKAPKTPRPGNE